MKVKIKAAYLEKLGQPLVYAEDIELPDLKEGQVLVKLAYSGVCHSQIMEAKGKRGPDAYLPHMLGHEGTGVVIETGSAVKKVKPGDHVVLGWIKGHGLDAGGCVYHRGKQSINAGGVTTFMDHAVVSENRLALLPSDFPMDVGVLFGCAFPTGAGMVLNTLKPSPGSTLAVWGLGGIGLCALMATRLYQCSRVIAVDINPDKLKLAQKLGATDVINSQDCDPVQTMRGLTGGKGVDFSVEASGVAQIIEKAFDAVKRGGGVCVFASHPEHSSRISLDPFELICGKKIMGSWGGESHPDRDLPRFIEIYQKGMAPLDLLLSKPYSLSEINRAMDDLEKRRISRALVSF